MFTGIIHHQGLFKGYRSAKKELAVEVPPSFPALEIGESVAVDGGCLSLLRREADMLSFHISQETMAKTSLGLFRGGGKVNLGVPFPLPKPVRGHLGHGHLAGRGRVLKIVAKPPGRRLTISFPR